MSVSRVWADPLSEAAPLPGGRPPSSEADPPTETDPPSKADRQTLLKTLPSLRSAIAASQVMTQYYDVESVSVFVHKWPLFHQDDYS